MFGEGVVSTPDDEFGGTFSPDGRTMLYNKSIPRSQFYVVMETRWENGRWREPNVAPFSGRWRDSDPVFSKDGSRVYFASDRPVGGVDRKNFDIWYVPREGNRWGEPVNLGPPINSDKNEDFISFAGDGTAYFTSAREGAQGYMDAWRSRLVGGKYTEPENLGLSVNREGWMNIESWIADDESFLMVGAFGHTDGPGDSDVFVSYRGPDGAFGPLKPSARRSTRPRASTARACRSTGNLFSSRASEACRSSRARSRGRARSSRRGRALRNGLGNIYRVSLEEALRGTRAR